MVDEIHNISLLLGNIQAGLQALDRKVDTNNSRAEAASAKMLSALDDHDTRLDALANDSREMREQLDLVAQTAKDSKEVTDDVKRWRQLGVGIIGIVGIGAAWVGANGAVIFDAVMHWLKARLGIP